MNADKKKYIIIASIIVASIIGRISYLAICEYNEFKEAVTEGNIKKCRAFAENHPDSKRLPQLYEAMAQIEEDFYQQKLNKEFEHIAYDDVCYYVKTYPEGQYSEEVNELKYRFEDKLTYDEAVQKNTSYAWKNYIDRYPDGSYTNAAKKNYQQALQREEKQKDKEDYLSAQNLNTKEAWQAYLRQHPKGAYRSDAKAAIQLIDDIEYYSDYSLANGSQPYRSVYGSNYSEDYGMSTVEVIAPTDCDVVVTARYLSSGKIKGHIYVRAGRTASFYIPEGKYTISFYHGNGWYPKKKMVGKHGTLYGGFLSNESVIFDIGKYYPANGGWTYTLQSVINGNFSGTPGSTYEMF